MSLVELAAASRTGGGGVQAAVRRQSLDEARYTN